MPVKTTDYSGISGATFQLGIGGPQVKANAGVLEARNAADNAYATFVSALINVTGEDVVWNSDAAGSGADWTYTLRRPSAGMTAAVILTWPIDDGAPSQVLSTDGSGNMSWISAGSTSHLMAVDVTALAFGSTSPVTAFTLPANAVVHLVEVIVDTAFNGTAPTMSVGISGTTSKYMPATAVDLKTTGSYEYRANLIADGGTNAIIITYAADSSSAGAARVMVRYSIPN
jgi:hypothetical protein